MRNSWEQSGQTSVSGGGFIWGANRHLALPNRFTKQTNPLLGPPMIPPLPTYVSTYKYNIKKLLLNDKQLTSHRAVSALNSGFYPYLPMSRILLFSNFEFNEWKGKTNDRSRLAERARNNEWSEGWHSTFSKPFSKTVRYIVTSRNENANGWSFPFFFKPWRRVLERSYLSGKKCQTLVHSFSFLHRRQSTRSKCVR